MLFRQEITIFFSSIVLFCTTQVYAARQGDVGPVSSGSAEIGVTILPSSKVTIRNQLVSDNDAVRLCVSLNTEDALYSVVQHIEETGLISPKNQWHDKAQKGRGRFQASRGHGDCTKPNVTIRHTNTSQRHLYIVIPE